MDAIKKAYPDSFKIYGLQKYFQIEDSGAFFFAYFTKNSIKNSFEILQFP